MSFIENENGVSYKAGYFLSSAICTRETMEGTQSLATTYDDGTMYVKAGTIYPSNDEDAIGIVYEDCDVTNGNMPCSVVTKGSVYEDILPITSYAYNAVTPAGTENPSEEGWYEADDDTYVLSTDTTVDSDKTYYTKDAVRMSSDARTALVALGFTFSDKPVVTR